MSSEAFVNGARTSYAAWETEKKVHFGRMTPEGSISGERTVSPDGVNEKYPALALSGNGTLLVAWTEGMGWKRGGAVHWQMFDKTLQPLGMGTANGVPVWSLIAAYPTSGGNFVVLY